MNRLTIYQRLLLGFGLLLLQLLMIAGIAMYSMANTSNRLGVINNDIAPQVEAANKMSQAVGQALSAVGNIGIVTGAADVDREYGLLKTSYASYEANATALAEKAQSSSLAPLLRQQEQSYRAATGYYRSTLEKIGASGTAQDAAIVIRMEVRANQEPWAKAQAQWQKDMRTLQDELAQLIDTEQHSVRAQNQHGLTILAVAVVVAVLFGALATWLITGSIRRPLQQAVTQSEHLADGNLTVPFASQAEDEIAHLLRSMEAMRQRWSATVTDLRDASRNIHVASSEISSGNTDLANRTERMSAELDKAAHETSELIDTLREAMRTADKEIKQLIATSVEKVNSGAVLVKSAGLTMAEIERTVTKVSELIQTVADNSVQQEARASLVSTSVVDLNDVTQKNAALVEEVAATAEGLKQQTQRLNGLVDFFQVENKPASLLALR